MMRHPAALRLKNMNIPENIKEMQDAIRKYDLEIEDAIKNEAYTEAAEHRRNQQELMKSMIKQ